MFNNSSLKKGTLIFVGFLIITLLFTYPLIFHLDKVVQNLGDPLFNSWIISWDVHSLTTNPLQLFNANIFFPKKNTLAFSDHMFSNALIALILSPIFKNPITIANLILIISFLLSASGTYLLVKDLTDSDIAAFISGIIFAFAPFRFSHLGHLQILSFHWLPFFLFFAQRFIKTRKQSYFWGMLIFYLLQILVSWYLAMFITVTLILFMAYALVAGKVKLDKNLIMWASIFFIVSGAIIALFAAPYLIAQKNNQDFTRHISDAVYHSAGFKSYLSVPGENWLYGNLTAGFRSPQAGVERELFPGVVALLLAAYGILSKKKWLRKKSSFLGFYIILLVVAFVFSFGPYKIYGNTHRLALPYLFFYKYFPGFKAMRAPARFAMLAGFALAVLAGYGVAGLERNFSNRKISRSLWYFVSGLMIILIILEYLSIPISLVQIETGKQVPKVYRWLKRQKKNSVVLELPYVRFDPNGAAVFNSLVAENRYLYFSTFHWQRLVNGYSGYFPRSYYELGEKMQSFPSRRAVNALKEEGVDYIVVHENLLGKSKAESVKREAKKNRGLRLIEQLNHDLVYTPAKSKGD